MPLGTNGMAIRRYVDEVWNRGMLEVADELLVSAHVRHDPVLKFDVVGIDEVKTQVLALREAFPDFRFEVSIYASSDDEGFVTILDRKKNIIITAGGKNIAPQPIENALRHTPAGSGIVVTVAHRDDAVLLSVCDDIGQREWSNDCDDCTNHRSNDWPSQCHHHGLTSWGR